MAAGGGVMMKVVIVLVACMMVVGPMAAEASLNCNSVQGALAPCIGYLTGRGPLPNTCCGGVQRLNGLARSTPDRQTACRCLQDAARRIPTIKPNLAAALPRSCNVNIPYAISLSTNCNNVK